MKKNLLWSVILLTAGAMAMTSCNNEKLSDPPGREENKEAATFLLTLQMPPLARAGEHLTTGAESNIVDISVYVFDTYGMLPTDQSKGRFTNLLLAQDFIASGNRYVMRDELETTAGLKHIYVLANLAENGITQLFNSETELLEAVNDVHGALIKYDASDVLQSIVFDGKYEGALHAVDLGPNLIEVEIGRAISRVVATSAPNYVNEWSAGNDARFDVVKYFIAQDAYRSYTAENLFTPDTRIKTLISQNRDETDWVSVIRPWSPAPYQGTTNTPRYIDIIPDAATQQGRADMDRFYIGENAPNYPYGGGSEQARHGNTTYAWIYTQMSMDATAVVNGTGDAIEYTGSAIAPGTTFYLVRAKGLVDHICSDQTSANAVAQFIAAASPTVDVNIFDFPGGNIFYRVFLNRTDENGNTFSAEDKFNVYRNQFIHLDITGINIDFDKPGGFGTIYPGDPTNPEVPIDPIPKVPDPRNPNPPFDPKTPIDEIDATVKVNITVKPWDYAPNQVILE